MPSSGTPSNVLTGDTALSPEPVEGSAPASPRFTGPPAAAARAVTYLRTAPAASLATIGRAVQMTASVLRYSVLGVIRGDLPVRELFEQMWRLLKVTTLPALLMAVPIGAEISVQVGGIMNQVGANSLAGAASGLGVVGQGAPMAWASTRSSDWWCRGSWRCWPSRRFSAS